MVSNCFLHNFTLLESLSNITRFSNVFCASCLFSATVLSINKSARILKKYVTVSINKNRRCEIFARDMGYNQSTWVSRLFCKSWKMLIGYWTKVFLFCVVMLICCVSWICHYPCAPFPSYVHRTVPKRPMRGAQRLPLQGRLHRTNMCRKRQFRWCRDCWCRQSRVPRERSCMFSLGNAPLPHFRWQAILLSRKLCLQFGLRMQRHVQSHGKELIDLVWWSPEGVCSLVPFGPMVLQYSRPASMAYFVITSSWKRDSLVEIQSIHVTLKEFVPILQVINNYKCSTSCKRAVRIQMGARHDIMLYPDSIATYNGRAVKLPKTVDKSVILERIGMYTVVRLLSGR